MDIKAEKKEAARFLNQRGRRIDFVIFGLILIFVGMSPVFLYSYVAYLVSPIVVGIVGDMQFTKLVADLLSSIAPVSGTIIAILFLVFVTLPVMQYFFFFSYRMYRQGVAGKCSYFSGGSYKSALALGSISSSVLIVSFIPIIFAYDIAKHITKSPDQMIANFGRGIFAFVVILGIVLGFFVFLLFSDGRAAFYPNFTSATISTGSFSSVPYRFFDFCFQYRIGRVKLQMMEMAVDNEVERLARQMFLPGMSEATKAFLAHNHLAHTIRYTLLENASNLDSSYIQSAYGALIEKKCVCQGYAEAFKRLMDYAGIPCDVVCGQTKGSDTYHAWNILRLNGGKECYHVDVTWDSSDGRVSYNYFGLRDADFAGERTWNRRLNAVCASPKSLLVEARREIPRFKARLMANGVSTKLLGY